VKSSEFFVRDVAVAGINQYRIENPVGGQGAKTRQNSGSQLTLVFEAIEVQESFGEAFLVSVVVVAAPFPVTVGFELFAGDQYLS
jgi:hypothetical protein